jgi:hypothetical protein
MRKVNCIDSIVVLHQLSMTNVYIGSRMQLFESDTRKSFLNKLNLKP